MRVRFKFVKKNPDFKNLCLQGLSREDYLIVEA